jgi:hypothetical protein
MNILLELLTWYQGKGDHYREVTLLEDSVNEFLLQRAKKKIVSPCHSLDEVKQNVVGILGLMGNPYCTTKNDLMEIDEIAMEIYEFLSK